MANTGSPSPALPTPPMQLEDVQLTQPQLLALLAKTLARFQKACGSPIAVTKSEVEAAETQISIKLLNGSIFMIACVDAAPAPRSNILRVGPGALDNLPKIVG